jgi:hypothetical protein
MRILGKSQDSYHLASTKMATENAFTLGLSLIETILAKMADVGKCQKRFITEILLLMLSLRGKVNFLQMGRYGLLGEQSYRLNFEKPFDFLAFNSQLIKMTCSEEKIIVFDPSYISKSGKHTPGIGNFYSGCAGTYKHGLELGGIAVVDIKQNTSYHVEAIQSPAAKKNKLDADRTLVDHYAEVIIERSEKLELMSSTFVADGYFAKKKFVDAMCEKTNLELISRLRDDANLNYIYTGQSKTGRGRPKKYAGKVNVKNIDKRRLRKCFEDDIKTIYQGVVYSVGLKRNIKIAYVDFLVGRKKKKITKIFFSTDMNQCGIKIVRYYAARYQEEFLFRDAKQFTGLEHCQARSAQKLYSHFNFSLTAISVGKAIIRKGVNPGEEKVLSISDVKTELSNRLLACRIFSIYGFDPKLMFNKKQFRQILDYGKIAA